MKVNKSEVDITVAIKSLFVGQTFTAPRKGYVKNGSPVMGYYMKVDKSSGIPMCVSQCEDLAVNLETGQLRKFNKDDRVTAVSVECNIINN